jgi:hypothetical protein
MTMEIQPSNRILRIQRITDYTHTRYGALYRSMFNSKLVRTFSSNYTNTTNHLAAKTSTSANKQHLVLRPECGYVIRSVPYLAVPKNLQPSVSILLLMEIPQLVNVNDDKVDLGRQ